MAGKQVYLTEKEIQLIQLILDVGNYSWEGHEDEEQREAVRENILRKIS